MAKLELAKVSTCEEDAQIQIDDDGLFELSNKEKVFIIEDPFWYSIVQPGSLRKKPELKAYVGKFANVEQDVSFEEKKFVYIGVHSEGRNRFPAYESDGADEPLCKSFDGIVPAFNAEQPGAELCAECPFGELMWKDGNKPECVKFINLLVLDLEFKCPMIIPLKVTSLGAWNKFTREVTTRIKHAKTFDNAVRLGMKKAKGKPKDYLDISKAVIQVSLDNKGTYFAPIFELVEDDSIDPVALQPVLNYYGYTMITKAAEERAKKNLEYAKSSTVGNTALLESAPETAVDLGTTETDKEDEDFDV